MKKWFTLFFWSSDNYNGNIRNNKLEPLDFCKKDGEEMYKVLKLLGYGIPDNNRLIGHVGFYEMRDAIYDFFYNNQTAADDTLLFYYSGHGIPISEGNMCLASSETHSDTPKKRGFTSYNLTNLIQNSNSIRIIEILDFSAASDNVIGIVSFNTNEFGNMLTKMVVTDGIAPPIDIGSYVRGDLGISTYCPTKYKDDLELLQLL